MPGQPQPRKDPEQDSRGKRLESWKEIAGYLNRHVTTIRRWEKHEGLPVHRHRHSKLGSIYAYTREVDAWFESRREESGAPAAATRDLSDSSECLPPPPQLSGGGAREAIHLTGREEEISLLRSSWERTAQGQQQIAVVTGEPGVGKTRLVMEFARSIARHATVLVGRCDREALIAYAPWVPILQWMIRTTPAQALRRHLAGVEAAGELALIVPEIATRIHIGAPAPAAPDGSRYRLFEAASQLLAAASRGVPILAVIDDLHWADQGSLLLLRHIIRATRHAAICVVITHRNDVPEWSPDFRDLVESLRREHSPTRIALHRLSDDDVRDMIEEWIGRDSPPALTRFVTRHTEGNPLFVVEMLKHLDETGALGLRPDWHGPTTLADVGLPEGIRQLIGRRLERLGPTTRRLLTIAAVLGSEFRLTDIEALVDVGEDPVLDAMDEALTAGIVTEEPGAPGRFSFTHTLIRESLYTSITAARRVRLHHRIAEALEQQASPAGSRVAELAYHFGEAAVYKRADKAVEYATRAGDLAAATLAFESAAHWYDVALRAMDFAVSNAEAATPRRFELHTRRGRSFFAVGQWAPAKNAFEAAASLLDPAEHERKAELLVRLAETAFWLMDVPALRKFAGEAQGLADRSGRDDLWADAQAWMASARVSDGDVMEAIQMDRQALARAGGIRSFGLARMPLTLYWAGLADEAIRHGLQAVETARASGDPSFQLYALQHLGLSLSGAGRFDEALGVFDEARAFGRRCGALPLLARATSMSVAPLLSLGDLDGAMARALDARELAHRVAFEPPLVSAGIDLLMIFARQEDPGRAGTVLDETAQAVQKAGGWHAWKWSMRLSQARAELACARGAWGEAVEAATYVIEQSRSRHRPKYEALGLATRARAARRLGARSAVKDARAAVVAGRRLADPAVLLDCLILLLDIEGTDALLDEARRTAQQIVRAVSDETLRSAFLTSVGNKAPRVVAAP